MTRIVLPILVFVLSYASTGAQQNLVLSIEYDLIEFPNVNFLDEIFAEGELATWEDILPEMKPREKEILVVNQSHYRINWSFDAMGDIDVIESLFKVPELPVFLLISWLADPNKVEFHEREFFDRYRWAPQGTFRRERIDFGEFFEGPIVFGLVMGF